MGADAEKLDAENIDLYTEACRKFGRDAWIAWCSVMRNTKPWRSHNLVNEEAVKWISEKLEKK